MSDAVATALIYTAPSILGSVLSLLVFVRQGKQGEKIEVIHTATNSLTERLVKSTAEASHAEGRAQGLAEGKAFQDPPQAA